jgi:hypothetical protein
MNSTTVPPLKTNNLSLYFVPKDRRRRGSNMLISGSKGVYRLLNKQGNNSQQIQVVTSQSFDQGQILNVKVLDPTDKSLPVYKKLHET